MKCFGSLRGFSPLKNLPAGESPLHLEIRKNFIFTYLPLGIFLDCCSFYCDFPLPAVRLFPAFGSGRLTAAPEQPFLAAQALTSVRCARVDFIPPLNPLSRADCPAPAQSQFLYWLCAAYAMGIDEQVYFLRSSRKLTRLFAAVFGVWVCCTLLFAA